MENKIFLVLVHGLEINKAFARPRRIRNDNNSWYYYFKREESAERFIRQLDLFCHAEYDIPFEGDYFEGGGFYAGIAAKALAKDKKAC